MKSRHAYEAASYPWFSWLAVANVRFYLNSGHSKTVAMGQKRTIAASASSRWRSEQHGSAKVAHPDFVACAQAAKLAIERDLDTWRSHG
jgi:hypothetical protein